MNFEDIRKKHGLGTKEEKTKEKTTSKNLSYSEIAKKHGVSFDVDENYLDDFIKAANEFSSVDEDSAYGAWNRLDLGTKANNVRGYLYHNKSAYSADTYKSLSDTVDNLVDLGSYFSKWDTEEAYLKSKKDERAYTEKLNFDLEEGQQEIDALQKDYDAILAVEKHISQIMQENQVLKLAMAKGDRNSATKLAENEQIIATSNKALEDAYKKYGSKEQLAAALSQKQQYHTLASRAQKGVELSSVVSNEDFDANSKYKSTEFTADNVWEKMFHSTEYDMGYDDLTHQYINGDDAFRSEVKSKHSAYSSDNSYDDGESRFEKANYDHMTEDEVNIYNYYYNTAGKEKAEEYLDSIQETLNYRAATKTYNGLEDETLQEMLFGVVAGLDQFKTGLENLFSNEDYIVPTDTQMASGMVREDLADAGAKLPEWMGGASVGQLGYDMVTTTSNMLPSIITSAVASAVAPGSGAIVGAGLLGASASGNAYAEMLNLGYDKGQARSYALLVGASEAGLQYALGGIGKLGGKLSGNAISKFVSQFDNAIARAAIKFSGNMLSEGLEESIQSVLEHLFKSIATGEEFEGVAWEEVIYSGLMGALSAGILEGGSTISGEVATYQLGKDVKKVYAGVERLQKLGQTFSADTVAYKIAGKVNAQTGAYTIGRLLNEVGASLSEQNKTDIANALVAKGVTETDAKTMAKWLGKAVDGGSFTEGQIAALESNEVVSSVIKDVIINPNSTVNQRIQGYNETLRSLAEEMSRGKAKPTKAQQTSSEQAGVPTDENIPSATNNTPAKEIATESEFKASEDGKTRIGDMEVSIKEIASVKDGKVILRLDDDSMVEARDVDFGSSAEVQLYENVAHMGWSPDVANSFVNGYDGSMPVDNYAKGFREAYRYGEIGIPMTEVTNGVFSSGLAEATRKLAYDYGKADVKVKIESKQAKIASIGAIKAENNASKGKKKGKLHNTLEPKNETQRASLKTLGVLADTLGIDIYTFESKEVNGKRQGANGWYDSSDNSIHIDLYAGVDGKGTMLFTAAHELTHHIREKLPAKFKAFADFLFEQYAEKGISVSERIEAKIKDLEANGRTKGMTEAEIYDLAYEEVVADSCESFLADGEAVAKITELKAKDKTLWQTIKDFINNLVARIKAAYEGLSPDSVEGRYVAEMLDNAEKLKAMWAEMVVEASDIVEIDAKTESVSPMFSERTWTASEYVTHRDQMAVKIAKALDVSVAKAKSYIDDINSIAKMIADDRTRLDYEASSFGSAFVSNVEYGGSFDYTTLCKKRRIYTGTFTEIQKRLKDVALTPDDILTIRNLMIEEGIEATCGLCYVEGSRANMGKFAKEFIRLYKRDNPLAWIPNMADVNTPDGVEQMRISHPEAYEQYVYFWNHYGKLKDSDPALFASQQKPKLYEARKEYKGEILEHFEDVSTVSKKNRNGGIRMQSFSDFEIVHLIDTMQVIMDMSTVGLAGQAYTKVPEFAKAFGNTGLKINLSLIAKGVDADGNLVFDDREGMPHETAFELRDKHSKNVGTIIVTFTDEQLLAAMADPRIDFIIPFHRSQWKKGQYGAMGLPKGTKDYTYMQNEKFIKKTYHEYRGRMVLDKASNYMPNEYWDFSKSGKENAEAYLKMCAENNKRPKFYKLLDHDGKGTYSLKADGSTDGYWKLLIDFKMYDNDGVGSPQMPVAPTFNMDEASTMLEEYQGGHSKYPVASGVVDTFVEKYNTDHGTKYSDRASKKSDLNSNDGNALDNYWDNSYNLYTTTDDFIRQVPSQMRHDFARSLANKTSGMTEGEIRTVYVSGYIFEADKYMHGHILAPYSENTKNLLKERQFAYERIDEDRETATLWSETIQNAERGGSGDIGSPRGRRSSADDKLLSDPSERYTSRYTERERQTFETKEEADEIVKNLREMYGLDAKKYSDRDSEGNTLSEGQREFFKDSKVRDKNGNLLVAYHSTPNDVFYEFDETKHKTTTGTSVWGKGFYFSDEKASYYWSGEVGAKNTLKCYLNIKNPLYAGNGERVPQDLKDYIISTDAYKESSEYRKKYLESGLAQRWYDFLRFSVLNDGDANSVLQHLGYDGIIVGDNYEIVIFDSNQAKLASNQNPTESKDIRYSDRPAESVSNRSLLANALESVAQNDIERNKLSEYKAKIALIEAEQKKLSEIRAKIKELSFAKGPRDAEAIKKLQFTEKQTANRINTYDRQLLTLEATAALKGVLDREKKLAYKRAEQKGKEALAAYRERATKTQRELLTRYQESRKKGVEGRKQTAMRLKVKNIVNELNQYLLKGTKEKHVPIGLQGVVAEALAVVNMDTVGAEERLASIHKQLEKDPLNPELLMRYKRIADQGNRMDEKLQALKNAYDEIVNSDDPLIANSHDEVISNSIVSVIKEVGDTPLRDMSLSQLEAVYDMYKMVLTSIRNTNKAFKAAKNTEISTIANGVIAELMDQKRKTPYSSKAKQTMSEFDWNNLKPVYAFERIGSANFTTVFDAVREGEDVWAKDMSEAQAFREEQFQKHKYDSWDFNKRFGFTSTSGKTFELSLDQIMSLYAFSKRDQAGDHLKYGGFVFDGLTEVKVKNKAGVTVKYQLKDATAYNLSEETLAEIIGTLTPEQKAFVDVMQDYLSTVMGEKGNEVSLALYDIKLFKEKYYFPLKSAPQYLAKAKEQAMGEVKIKNSGFTKETTPKAKNPIVLSSFMDVWAGHVNDMSMYHSFTLPLEDFYRVYNYHTPADKKFEMVSVGASLENAHGEAAVKYIDQLLKDLNGGARSDPRDSIGKALMANFKKASVMLSWSVVIQQPSAIIRAQALVDAKYFAGKKVAKGKHKEMWAEVKKYAPIAVIKEMGYFDTGMGKSSVEWLKGEKTFMDIVDDAASWAPSLADEVTWVSIWNAVKRETLYTHKNLKPNSEEFLKAVGERFTEVIVKTQVYDSTLSRSANMRSKSTWMNMVTSFLAEPTTSINMLQDSFRKGKRGKYTLRVMGAVYGSVLLNSALVSIIYAMRDDDEDETFWEKYLSRFTTEMIDGINPLTYIPLVKDAWSLLQGYDIERADMSLISDVVASLQQMVKLVAKDTSDMDEDELTEHKKAITESVLKITDSISACLGVPVKNVRRDLNGIINAVKTIYKDATERDATAGSLGDNILEDVKDSVPVWGWFPDESKGDKLYDAIVKGDTAYTDRLKSGYKTDTAYQSAVRKALRENDPRIKEAAEARYAGRNDEYMQIVRSIKAEGKFSQDTIVAAINAEISKLKPDKESSVSSPDFVTVDDYYNSIINGDTGTARTIFDMLVKEKLADGYLQAEAEDLVASSFSTKVKGDYTDKLITRSKAKSLLISHGNKSDSEAEVEIKKCDFELKHDIAWSERARAYRLGKISERELVSAVVDIEGATQAEAEEYIRFLDLEMDNPALDISASDASKYFEFAEPANIGIDVYLDYKDRTNGLVSDKDEKGKSIDGSKKKKVMAEIDSLPLTSAQKDALYFANGWSKTTIYEAPWR